MSSKCINCGGDQFELINDKLRDSIDYKVVKCKKCNLIQLDKIPEIQEDQDYYDKDKQVKSIIPDFTLDEIKNNAMIDVMRRYEHFSKLRERAINVENVLEMGCGYGFFVGYLLEKGIDIDGIEIGDERRRIANTICGNRIKETNLLIDSQTNKGNHKKYDLVCLFQVLEHISDPVVFLKKIKQFYMKDSSLLMIEVPNADDEMLQVSKDYFDFYWQRAHLVYYNIDSLKMIVEKAGFKVHETYGVQRYGLENAFNWIINCKPQLRKPSYEVVNQLKWLETYYKENLEKTFNSDTIIMIASKEN